MPPPNDNFDVEIVLLRRASAIRTQARSASPTRRSRQDTGSFIVRAVLPNPKQELRPGMFVTALVLGAQCGPNAIVVPQLAVQQGSNGHLVYVVNDKRRRRDPAGGRRRLLRRQGHRDHWAACAAATASSVDGVMQGRCRGSR